MTRLSDFLARSYWNGMLVIGCWSVGLGLLVWWAIA